MFAGIVIGILSLWGFSAGWGVFAFQKENEQLRAELEAERRTNQALQQAIIED